MAAENGYALRMATRSKSPDFWKPLDSLTIADVQTLLGHPEHAALDYKLSHDPSRSSPEALGDDLAAFANTGVGRLIFGAKETNDELVDLPGERLGEIAKLRSRIRNAAHTVQPSVKVDMQHLPISAERSVLVVEVTPAPSRRPHQHRGRYLFRSADGNVPMPHSMVVALIRASSRHDSPLQQQHYTCLGYIHPFGAPVEPGWFCGIQMALVDSSPEPLFEVYDDLGASLRAEMATHEAVPLSEIKAALTSFDLNRVIAEGTITRRRIQVTVDGGFSSYFMPAKPILDVDTTLSDLGDELGWLATLAAQVLPNGIFQSSVGFWTHSDQHLELRWKDKVAVLPSKNSVIVNSRRQHFPASVGEVFRSLSEKVQGRMRVLAGIL